MLSGLSATNSRCAHTKPIKQIRQFAGGCWAYPTMPMSTIYARPPPRAAGHTESSAPRAVIFAADAFPCSRSQARPAKVGKNATRKRSIRSIGGRNDAGSGSILEPFEAAVILDPSDGNRRGLLRSVACARPSTPIHPIDWSYGRAREGAAWKILAKESRARRMGGNGSVRRGARGHGQRSVGSTSNVWVPAAAYGLTLLTAWGSSKK